MAEDPKLSQRYRELPREEPSREIDAAILAAARRAAETRPAPLVVPSGRRRWYFPLAAAAIIVLAVAVTIHVEREQPDPEIAVAPVTVPEAQREEQPAPPPELRAQRDAARAETQAAPPPAPASPPVDATSGVRESRMARLAAEPPEKWLERIAELRKQGKHDEADKALAEFRRAYPDYRISEAMLEKVEKK